MQSPEKFSLIVIGGGITGLSTAIKNLYQPKFSHGIWPCLQAGMQVVDRKIVGGNSRYEGTAERAGEENH